ncbi:MAG: type I-C CRISPR-associated protein Cas8c/Csd1, partial [Eubacteriales bacterium]
KRLGEEEASARWYQRLLGEIERQFRWDERMQPQPLSYLFLIGFCAQLRELFCKLEDRQPSPEFAPYSPPQSRDELFGCLLAVADDCEWNAERSEEDGAVSRRDGCTNAMLLTTAFTERPGSTWAYLHDRLIPYLEKSGVRKAESVQRLLSRIEQGFDKQQRLSAAPLGTGFLHGYFCMRYALITKNGLEKEAWEPESGRSSDIGSRDEAFGALLAIENRVERWVLDQEKTPDENRPSNAMRFLPRAAQRPDEVAGYLMERMRPYLRKLSFPKQIEQEWKKVNKLVIQNGWDTPEPLGCGYLHAFYTYDLFGNNRKEG